MKKSIKLSLAIAGALVVLIAAAIFVLALCNIHLECVSMGESEMLCTTLSGDGVIYSSSNESVATVDGNGCVTGHKNGIVFITVSSGAAKDLQETFIYTVDSDFDEQQEAVTQNFINTLFIFFIGIAIMLGLSKIGSAIKFFVRMNNNANTALKCVC